LMNENAIIEKLDELIAVTKSAAIPITDRWIDARGIAALLSSTPSNVLQRLACRPDFPKANRVGHPRWKATEVLQWMEDTRDGKHKPGRKRLPP